MGLGVNMGTRNLKGLVDIAITCPIYITIFWGYGILEQTHVARLGMFTGSTSAGFPEYPRAEVSSTVVQVQRCWVPSTTSAPVQKFKVYSSNGHVALPEGVLKVFCHGVSNAALGKSQESLPWYFQNSLGSSEAALEHNMKERNLPCQKR